MNKMKAGRLVWGTCSAGLPPHFRSKFQCRRGGSGCHSRARQPRRRVALFGWLCARSDSAHCARWPAVTVSFTREARGPTFVPRGELAWRSPGLDISRSAVSRAPRFLWTAFCEKENALCPRENRARLGPRREPGGRRERPQPRTRSSAGGGGLRVGRCPWSSTSSRARRLESLSRRHGVTAAKLSQWRDEFLAGGEARLKHRETAVEDEDTRRLKSVVADLATDKALLVEKIRHLEAGRPLGWWRSKG